MSGSRSHVSVIIPTFNRAAYIASSIDSVLTQTHPPTQVIVVDDGSKDETEPVVSAYGDRVQYLRKPNGGKPSAINRALPLVTGEYLWIFDDDDVACADALERQVTTLLANPQAGFTFGFSYHCSSHPTSGALCIERERKIASFPDDDYFFPLLMSSYAGSPGILVRTDIQRKAGLYNESLIRSQDWDMGLRLGLIAPAVRTIGQTPTFLRRFHDGLRGIGNDQFSYSEYTRRARAAERNILSALMNQMPLDRLLPYSKWNKPLSEADERRARFRKLSLLVRKGLWREASLAMHDVANACAHSADLTAEEERLMYRALSEYGSVAELANAQELGELTAHTLPRAFDPVHKIWTRSVYWHFRRELSNGRIRNASHCARILTRLAIKHSIRKMS